MSSEPLFQKEDDVAVLADESPEAVVVELKLVGAALLWQRCRRKQTV